MVNVLSFQLSVERRSKNVGRIGDSSLSLPTCGSRWRLGSVIEVPNRKKDYKQLIVDNFVLGLFERCGRVDSMKIALS